MSTRWLYFLIFLTTAKLGFINAVLISKPFYDPHFVHYVPTVQRPLPIWGCITCSYANSQMCCQYYQRCCVNANFGPGFGKCQLTPVFNKCPQQCLSDGQCSNGQRCCPPASFVCVLPFALNQCPLSIPASTILTRCTTGDTCLAGQMCCPDPNTPGCCVSTLSTGPLGQLGNSLNSG